MISVVWIEILLPKPSPLPSTESISVTLRVDIRWQELLTDNTRGEEECSHAVLLSFFYNGGVCAYRLFLC
jgi:hypothetical protein